MEQNTQNKNQIEQIVSSAVANIRQAAEVNTVIGQPIVTADGTTILPISQVAFAFMAGGGQYGNGNKNKKSFVKNSFANQFAGGSGGGATLTPVGFLIVKDGDIRMINSVETTNVDKLINLAKDLFKNANMH